MHVYTDISHWIQVSVNRYCSMSDWRLVIQLLSDLRSDSVPGDWNFSQWTSLWVQIQFGFRLTKQSRSIPKKARTVSNLKGIAKSGSDLLPGSYYTWVFPSSRGTSLKFINWVVVRNHQSYINTYVSGALAPGRGCKTPLLLPEDVWFFKNLTNEQK